MLGFLIMIVLGFTIPGFIGNEDDPLATYVEARVCQTDTDCYLTCDGTPQPILCSQNLCIQNSCEEANYYPLNPDPLSFSLTLSIENETIALQSNPQNLFVTFDDNEVNLFSNGLNLNQVLDKAGMAMNTQCIQTNQLYCTNLEQTLDLSINGEKSYDFIGYVPKEGDEIEITYG